MANEISRIDSKPWAIKRQKRIEQLISRRARLIHLTTAGLTVSEAVEQLAKEYTVRPLQIWRDWMTRYEWLPFLLKTDQAEMRRVVLDRLAQLKEAIDQAYQTYLSCRSEHVRVNAIRLYMDSVTKDLEIRQKLGLLPAETILVEQRVVMLEGKFVIIGADDRLIKDDRAPSA